MSISRLTAETIGALFGRLPVDGAMTDDELRVAMTVTAADVERWSVEGVERCGDDDCRTCGFEARMDVAFETGQWAGAASEDWLERRRVYAE